MTTTPTTSPALPGLGRLEALARAALGLPDTMQPFVSRGSQLVVETHSLSGEQLHTVADFYDAASPAAVLALIAFARRAQPYATGGIVPGGAHLAGEGLQRLRAQPEVEAPQAVPAMWVQYIDGVKTQNVARDDKEKATVESIHRTMAPGTKMTWRALYDHAPAATLSPLCGAQHAENGKEVDSVGLNLEAQLRAVVRERDGWKEESEHQKACYERACESVEMLRDHERKQFWVWQGDGSDNLASMSRSMTILIRADQLRAQSAKSGELRLHVDAQVLADDLRRHHETDIWDWDDLLTAANMLDRLNAALFAAQQAAAPGAEQQWRRLDADDKPDASRWIDVVLDNGVTEYNRTYALIDWTAVRDWRYSAPGTPEAPLAAAVRALADKWQAEAVADGFATHEGAIELDELLAAQLDGGQEGSESNG